jgi:Na+-transporting NADH:ubiquinone oxidoreductase subunit NqrB
MKENMYDRLKEVTRIQYCHHSSPVHERGVLRKTMMMKRMMMMMMMVMMMMMMFGMTRVRTKG